MIHAKYTVVLKSLLDNPEVKPLIDQALSKYPLYKPEKDYDMVPDREGINQRLLNHYKYREIGFETVGRFLDELEITMGEIMPRYNELLKTVVTMADLPSPFDNVDVIETFEEERNDNSTSETSSTASDTTTTENNVSSNNKHVQSQTPQGQIAIAAKDIDSVPYADQVDWGKDNSNSEGSSTSNGETSATATNESSGTTKHTYTKTGNQGVNTYAHDMNEFRTSIIDVVDQIVNDPRIQELFMLVF
jgi:hypothetical protein